MGKPPQGRLGILQFACNLIAVYVALAGTNNLVSHCYSWIIRHFMDSGIYREEAEAFVMIEDFALFRQSVIEEWLF
jgi:hypothetical protein